ncbi:hypothetical protein ONZ45_g1963 [Pleurotus djamor]|nr:hypothetical protein ONZ45_g1963 [Pleurotus djamor]
MGIDIHSHTGLVSQNAAPDVPLQLQHLPVDVERLIVEVAAELGTQTALQLIRVVSNPLSGGLLEIQPPGRALFYRLITTFIKPAFANSSNVHQHHQPLVLENLSHVVADPDDPLPSDHPLRRVERLDVCSPDLYKWRLVISELSELTHLFFCEDYPSRIPSRASMSPLMPPNLRVCIIHVAASLTHHETVQLEQYINGKADPRVVIGADSYRPLDHEVTPNLLLRPFTKLLVDWSGASSETLDFWDLAEEIICVRRVVEERGGQDPLPRVCESNPSPETVKAAEELFQQVTENLENSDDSPNPVCPYTSEPIPVNFHIIAKDDKVGHVTEGQITRQIKVMNAAYAAHDIRFVLASIKVIINPDWYSNACPETSQQTDMKTALRSGDVKTLNVYSVGFEGCEGLLGYATFPSSYVENKVDDGVVILWEAFPGGSATNYNVGQVGHFSTPTATCVN